MISSCSSAFTNRFMLYAIRSYKKVSPKSCTKAVYHLTKKILILRYKYSC